MIQILRIIRRRLEDNGQQAEDFSFQLTLAVSKLLNVADHRVEGLNRCEEHEPLLKILSGLKVSEDTFLHYQALYAFQALQWIPNDESKLQCSLRLFAGMAGSLVKMSGIIQFDLKGFLGGLQEIQKTVADAYELIQTGLEVVPEFIEDGRGFFDSLKEGFGSGHKRAWYVALRSAQEMVRKGELKDLKTLTLEAP